MPGRKIRNTRKPGDIYWLPKKKELPPNAIVDLEKLDGVPMEDGCFGHPVVIVEIINSGSLLHVCLLSSLGGHDLEAYASKAGKPSRRLLTLKNHLPIHPAPPHPDSQKILHLQENAALEKNTYVKLHPVREIPLSILGDPYRQWKTSKTVRLDSVSLDKLLRMLGRSPSHSQIYTPKALAHPTKLPPPLVESNAPIEAASKNQRLNDSKRRIEERIQTAKAQLKHHKDESKATRSPLATRDPNIQRNYGTATVDIPSVPSMYTNYDVERAYDIARTRPPQARSILSPHSAGVSFLPRHGHRYRASADRMEWTVDRRRGWRDSLGPLLVLAAVVAFVVFNIWLWMCGDRWCQTLK